MNIQERRELLDSLAGKLFSISWVKKDNTVRTCVARHMEHAKFTLGHASKAYTNPVAGKEHLFTAVDTQKDGWINIDLRTLKSVKCGSVDIKF